MNGERSPQESAGRLLVVDDNPDNRDVLARRLARRGFDVTVAAGGAEALQQVASTELDAVLLDIEMPEVSGLEVLREIRVQYTKAQLPIIMATARTASEDMVEAFRLGANDYVTKPLDFPVVLARLETHLAVQREVRSNLSPVVVLSSERLEPGTVIDNRYRLERLMGEGGFAMVYAGEQIATGQPVAIKLLRTQRLRESEMDTELARFELEMRVIAQVTHSAIVRLVDSGTLTARPAQMMSRPAAAETTADHRMKAPTKLTGGGRPSSPSGVEPRATADTQLAGGGLVSGGFPEGGPVTRQLPYIVMERLSGETLADMMVARGKLDVSEAVDLLLPVLDGLHAVHGHGVVHRDAKPSNIFVARGGEGQLEPKLLDFGIAKLTSDDRPSLTQTSVLVGTPEYMAPEQARSEPIDTRCDQYTLGVVLYECVLGVRPYSGTACVELLQQIAAGDLRPPRDHDPSIEPQLEGTILRALALTPDERFEDMRAFGTALLPHASDAGRAHWARLQASAAPSGITSRSEPPR